tara:strand:- start:110 stop:2275 length:2166 start_codon:yes stop_codon:yes gene_type:complete
MSKQRRNAHSGAAGFKPPKTKSLGVRPIPPSRMGDRKRMWNFVHELCKPESNEELARVRTLAYKRMDREKSESRYLVKWLIPRCPKLAQLDEEHQLILVDKIELKQYGDKDVYQDTCGVLVRGWMVRNDEISNTVYGPGTCVDCMDHDVTYECWYGADDAAPEDIERIRRKQKMDLLLGAGAFSKAMKGITKTTNKWKKKAHTRITEVISFPLSSWEVVRETQRVDNIKKYVEVLKRNSKILGKWSQNRLYKLCDSGKVHVLQNAGDTLFRKGDPLSQEQSAFLILTGALRIQIRFTLKEAQRLAPKGVDYFCPSRYHKNTVVTLISTLQSGDCLRAISIVDEVWEDSDIDAFESADSSSSEEEEEEEDIELLVAEEQVWRKVFLIMQEKMVKPIQLFREIDQDDSGLIDPKELRNGLLNMVGMMLTDDEFKNILTVADRDNSGEIDYQELARAIKYGDPKREQSMQKQQERLEKIASKGAKALDKEEKKKKMQDKINKKVKERDRMKAMTKPEVPECEVVADLINTTILEIHKDSEAAALLRRTGMARKLLEVDVGKFNRKKLIKEWVRNKHATQHLKNGLEETMGPRAKNRREKERRMNMKNGLNKSKSVPTLLPTISPKKGVTARQQNILSDLSPYQSKNQLRRFKKVVTDIRSSVPTMGFNPVVLWEEDRHKKGELVMKVITRADDGGLNVSRYPTKLGGESPEQIQRYSLSREKTK